MLFTACLKSIIYSIVYNILCIVYYAKYYLHIIEDSKKIPKTKILLVWSLYYTNQQKSKHQCVGFYKSYKIS